MKSDKGNVYHAALQSAYVFNAEVNVYNLIYGWLAYNLLLEESKANVLLGVDANVGISSHIYEFCRKGCETLLYTFIGPYVMVGIVKLGFSLHTPFRIYRARMLTTRLLLDAGVNIPIKNYGFSLSISASSLLKAITVSLWHDRFGIMASLTKVDYDFYMGPEGYEKLNTVSPYRGISYSLKGGGK